MQDEMTIPIGRREVNLHHMQLLPGQPTRRQVWSVPLAPASTPSTHPTRDGYPRGGKSGCPVSVAFQERVDPIGGTNGLRRGVGMPAPHDNKRSQYGSGSGSGSGSGDQRDYPEPVMLSARDDAILRWLATYHFLLADQVRRLGRYRLGSLDYVRRDLKDLADEQLVLRLRLPRANAGNAPWVYTLSQQGYSYLADAARFGGGHKASMGAGAGAGAGVGVGVDAEALAQRSKRFRPAEIYERSYFFLTHTLAVNDFLIAAALLEWQVPDVVLAQMRHERDLKRVPARVTLGPAPTMAAGSGAPQQHQMHQQQVAVIPDGWLDFHIKRVARLCVALELDRGTEEEHAFTRKVRALLAYAAGPYQTAFGTDSLTIAFATTAGTRRAERIRVWCEQVLRSLQQEHEADLFYVTSLPEGELDPQTVFLAPIWSRPFATDRVPLIEL